MMKHWIWTSFFFSWISMAFGGSLVGSVHFSHTPIQGHPVRLKIFQNRVETQGAEVFTNAKGKFLFRDLETSPDFSYQVKLLFEEVLYESSVQHFSSSSILRIQPIQVFSSSSDPSLLEQTETFLLEFGRQNWIRVAQRTQLENKGKKVFFSKTPSVGIVLLQKTEDLVFENEGSQIVSWDPSQSLLPFQKPIFPGEVLAVHVSYLLPIQGPNLPFSLESPFPRKSLDLFFTSPKIKVQTQQLQPKPPLSIGKKMLTAYSGGPFPSQAPLSFTLSEIPLHRDWLPFLFWMGMILIFLWGLFLFLQPRKPKSS